MRPSLAHMSGAVCDVKLLPVAARIKAVRAPSGRNEAGLLECLSVDKVHAVGFHIGDEKELAVGRDPDVLRHAVRRSGLSVVLFIELHLSDDFPLHQIDLDKTATGKFARE